MKIFITGVSRGIGLELTRLMLADGHQVYGMARKPETSPELQALANQYAQQLQLLRGDVSSDADRQQLVNDTQGLGSVEALDLLVNNAGVYLDGNRGLAEISTELLEESWRTNTLAPLLWTRALLPKLLKAKQPRVAHLTSRMGSIADNSSGGYYAYRSSKAALNMFNKSFAVDFPQIASVVLHPGWVATDMGGKAAPLSPQDSARGLWKVIQDLNQAATGKFFDYQGAEIPW